MCKWGDTVRTELSVSSGGKEPVGIDRCIFGIVDVLNKGGITTVASCCGHDRRPGRISLADGTELFIAKSFNEATNIDKMFNEHGYKNICD